jgi:hypothetical protein
LIGGFEGPTGAVGDPLLHAPKNVQPAAQIMTRRVQAIRKLIGFPKERLVRESEADAGLRRQTTRFAAASAYCDLVPIARFLPQPYAAQSDACGNMLIREAVWAQHPCRPFMIGGSRRLDALRVLPEVKRGRAINERSRPFSSTLQSDNLPSLSMTLDMSAEVTIFHNVFETKMQHRACRLLALPLLIGLVACASSGSASSPAPQQSPAPPAILHPALKLVGVGDSLTAGEQSGGLVGVASSAIPNAAQTHGFWALIWNRANGGDLSSVQTSPLPLIKAPGLLTYLTLESGFPALIQNACQGYNSSAFSASTALQSRANPNVSPYDVGIPGQTVHEALFMTAPSATGPTGTAADGSFACSGAIPPMSGQVAAEYNVENTAFYPILATFGSNLTQVQAAASLHGEIATVWLGQNDQIKPLLVPGGIAPTPPEQFGSDITQIIRTLQQSGAKVAIANLMDELHPAAFIPQPQLAAALVRLTSQTAKPIDPATATVIAQKIDAFLQPYGVGSGGYVTFPELLTLATHLESPSPPPLGSTISDKLAAQEQTLNTAYNAQIAAAVAATGAALVDMHAFEAQAYAAGGIAVSPICCTSAFGGGMWSLDGIHPSNTFYAILANRFIGVIDKAFGKTIAPFSPAELAAIAANDPFAPK